ncbi:MAG: methionine-R-sulfoxide reductase [Saprospiraceae bacterium]|jgi:methionine-R-sulfoxide reductase|nr:methionine-R-sulfoxide reductase [Saprospiraceae bacterium]MDP4821005.1 methionine-R-sulfoxide reductase [Saprospiraceae bacterium]
MLRLHPAKSLLTAFFALLFLQACGQKTQSPILSDMPAVAKSKAEYNPLTPEEAYILIKKGTERAFTGAFHNKKDKGTYLCRQCNNPLFSSDTKFDSRSGWPSFDDMIGSNVKEVPDADGVRTEIICANCGGHLGHVFQGEGFTPKQTRHCVNSLSLSFVPENK